MTTVTCQVCQAVVPRRAPGQRYCMACSEQRDLERKRLWARKNPLDAQRIRAKVRVLGRQAELAKEAGRAINGRNKMSMLWNGQSGPELLWQVGISVPFSYAASKNHLYTMRSRGHVALRREARTLREEITLRLRQALAGQRVAHNKLWIDILVQKPDHRGDAVNVVDLVCDAIKAAVPVDDRWFSLRRLDWEIAKDDSRMFLKVGQESDEDCQVCSHCGQIRPFVVFTKRQGTRLGIDRVCRICRRQGRQLVRAEQARAAATPLTEPGPASPAIEDVPAKPRTCLKCSKTFASEGPWNRICAPCNRENDDLHLSESQVQRQRGVKRHNGEILDPDQQC